MSRSATSTCVLNPSRVGDSTTSLGKRRSRKPLQDKAVGLACGPTSGQGRVGAGAGPRAVGSGHGSGTLPAPQRESHGRTPVPGPPAVPPGSCSTRPRLPGTTGSLEKEKPNMEGRFLQTVSFFMLVQGSELRPSQGKPFVSGTVPGQQSPSHLWLSTVQPQGRARSRRQAPAPACPRHRNGRSRVAG